jgi:predicted Zn-dependent protease
MIHTILKPRMPLKATAFCVLVAFIVSGVLPAQASHLMSPKEEEKLGKKVLEELRSEIKLVKDTPISDYVNRVGQSIIPHVGPTNFPYDFNVVDEPSLNAFAIPGGHIFINRGLIELMDSEAELAGVLSHEIAHVQGRHIATRMQKMQKISIAAMAAAVLGVLAGGGAATSAIIASSQAAGLSMMLKYSREDEEEADRLGLLYMEKAGYDTAAMVSVFKKMLTKQWLSPSSIPAYLTTHPALDERIVYMENAIKAHQAADSANKDQKRQIEFEEMKIRLITLYNEPSLALTKLERLTGPKSEQTLHYGRGLILMRMDRPREAIEEFKKAAELNPGNASIYQSMGMAYFSLGDMAQAKTALSQALIISPEDIMSLFYLGRVYQQEGNWEMALRNFEEVRAVYPEMEQLYYNLAMVQSKLGNLAEAHFLYGIHSEKDRNFKNARYHFDKALELYRGNPGKTDEIEKHLKEVKEKEKERERERRFPG